MYTRRKFRLPNLFKLITSNRSDVIGPFNFENIEDISFEQSPENYFQFAVFSVVVHQFYLYWHACENDRIFIYSKSQIEDILRGILKKELERAIRDKDINNLIWDWKVREKMAEAELSALFQNRKSDDDISIYLGPKTELNGLRDINTGKTVPGCWTSIKELDALFNAPLNPQVTIMEDGYGVVRILTFSKWGGFVYYRYDIKWPNSIEKVHMEWDEAVLRYNCGIQF